MNDTHVGLKKINHIYFRVYILLHIIVSWYIIKLHPMDFFVGVRVKNLEATILCVDFTKALDSLHRGKMEQILLAYGLPKETVAAIMMLYRNTKVKFRSPNGDTDYFDIVAGVPQGDTLAPYLFIIYLDYVLRTYIDEIKKKTVSH